MFKNMDKGNIIPVYKPECKITINGAEVKNWISFTTNTSVLGTVDTFNVTLPWDVSDEPNDSLLFSGSADASVIVTGSADISISAGVDGKLTPLIEGKMDSAIWKFDNSGEIVVIRGRSFAAAPFDYKETMKFQNLTAKDAHAKIASFHGLTPVCPVSSDSFIGEYMSENHVSITRETSHWDYVQYLAKCEGFVSYVKGRNWYFGPLENNYTKEPLSYSWGKNISDILVERAPNAARNLSVEIISWQTEKKTRIVEKAALNSGGHKYVVREFRQNITRDRAQREARSMLERISRNQITGEVTTAFLPEIDTDRKITLYGVGKRLSEVYYITGVTTSGNSKELKSVIHFSNLPMFDEAVMSGT